MAASESNKSPKDLCTLSLSSSSLLFCLAPIRPFHLAIRPAIYLACLGLEATLRRPRQVGVRETERERERKRSRTVRTKPLLLSLRLLDAAGNKSIDPKPECEQCVESANWTTLLRTWGGQRVEIFVSIKSKGGNGWTHRSHCWCWAIKKKGALGPSFHPHTPLGERAAAPDAATKRVVLLPA